MCYILYLYVLNLIKLECILNLNFWSTFEDLNLEFTTWIAVFSLLSHFVIGLNSQKFEKSISTESSWNMEILRTFFYVNSFYD